VTSSVVIITCGELANVTGHDELSKSLGHVTGIIQNIGGVANAATLHDLEMIERGSELDDVVVLQHTGCQLISITPEFLSLQDQALTEISPESVDGIAQSVRSTIDFLKTSGATLGIRRLRGYVWDTTDNLALKVFEEFQPPRQNQT